MQAGDLFLVDGEGLNRCWGLLAQLLGPFDRRGRVGQPGGHSSFGLGGGPVDLCLLALAACLLPPHRFFLAVDALAAAGQQGTGPLDGRQRARLYVLHGRVQLLAPLAGLALPLVQLGFPLISRLLPFVGQPLPFVGSGFTFAGRVLPLISQLVPLVGADLALIGRLLPGRLGLPLSGLGGPWIRGWPGGIHASSMPCRHLRRYRQGRGSAPAVTAG